MDKLKGRVSLISIIFIVCIIIGIVIVTFGIVAVNYKNKETTSDNTSNENNSNIESSTNEKSGITKDKISSILKEYASSSENSEGYTINVEKNDIKITKDGKDLYIKYDLKDKPTFSIDFQINKGMTYDEYKEGADNVKLLMLGYIAIAGINGVSVEDASTYFLLTYAGSALSSVSQDNFDNAYTIYDDTSITPGVEFSTSSDKVISVSKFGERVMEYANSQYSDHTEISDSGDDCINSYNITIDKKDVTDTSCNIVSTITIDPNADFSKLKDYTQNFGGAFSK